MRQLFRAGDHRPKQVVPLHHGVDEDRNDMRGDRDLDEAEIHRVDMRQPVAPLLADIVEQRSLGVAIVVGAKPRRHLHDQQRQHQQYHPAARGIMANARVRRTPVQMRQITQRLQRALHEGREPRGVAADEPPGQAEQQQRDDAVAGQEVQLHPAAAFGQPARARAERRWPSGTGVLARPILAPASSVHSLARPRLDVGRQQLDAHPALRHPGKWPQLERYSGALNGMAQAP